MFYSACELLRHNFFFRKYLSEYNSELRSFVTCNSSNHQMKRTTTSNEKQQLRDKCETWKVGNRNSNVKSSKFRDLQKGVGSKKCAFCECNPRDCQLKWLKMRFYKRIMTPNRFTSRLKLYIGVTKGQSVFVLGLLYRKNVSSVFHVWKNHKKVHYLNFVPNHPSSKEIYFFNTFLSRKMMNIKFESDTQSRLIESIRL